MFRSLLTGLLLQCCLLLPALAQTGTTLESSSVLDPLIPIISGPSEVQVNRSIVLHARNSSGIGTEVEYEWYINDALSTRSEEIIITPTTKGPKRVRLVVRTVRDGEVMTGSTSRQIIAYERKVTIIADSEVDREKLEIHANVALDAGVYLNVVQMSQSVAPLLAEEQFRQLISQNLDALNGAEAIVLWSDDVSALQALMKVLENRVDEMEALKNQNIIIITDRSLYSIARTARGPFSLLQPKQILVTRKEAMNPLILSESIETFVREIEQRDIDYSIVDSSTAAIRPWNLLTSLVNYMILQGISSQIVILLLILPVIATILAFLKQVIGITTYGLYTPSILALSFLALGWKIGLVFLLVILASGYITRKSIRNLRILHVPKVAILLTVVSITLMILLAIASVNGLIFGRDTIFILLIMSTLAETLLSAKQEEGWYYAIIGMGETIGAALVCVAIVQWSTLQAIIVAYPETILLTILINILIGRFTGLRLVEFFRFREVIKKVAAQE